MKKTVFITGANKGIGYGIAKHLGLSGWSIVLGARNEERAEKAMKELKDLGIDVAGWVNVELADLESIEKAAAMTRQKGNVCTCKIMESQFLNTQTHRIQK